MSEFEKNNQSKTQVVENNETNDELLFIQLDKASKDSSTTVDSNDLDDTSKTALNDLDDASQSVSENDQDLELSDEEIAEKIEALKNNGLPTNDMLGHSAKRLANNGKIRFMIAGGVVATALVGAIGYSIISSLSQAPESSSPGEVTIPKTSAAASAIVNPEQAAYIKAQQDKAGLAAEKNGDTYIAGFITERENTDEELLPPSQPGVDSATPAVINQFYDKQGNAYSAEKAAELSSQGVQIEGVTFGAGSISDPTVNTKKNKENSSSVSSQTEQKVDIQPYVVTPLQAGAKTGDSGKSDFTNAQESSLDKSQQQVDEWSNEYLALRQKKAASTDKKTQHAFENQITNISKALKPAADTKETSGSFSRMHYASAQSSTTKFNENNAQNPDAKPKTVFKPLIYAGESVRAILKNEVNTDNGKEVIATLQQGPLKGAIIMGTVNVTSGNIQFNFTRLLRKGKGDINITAMGREIGSNSSGMADDIQKHYIKRYAALALSTALSGVGTAYEQTSGSNAELSNGTVVTQSTDPSSDRIIGNVVGELGNEVSDEIKNIQRTPTTYITFSGKVFNVFFSQNVQETTEVNK